ncbi:hypothetical protein DI09_3p60 [Mitosporidium daphniae]|uniref:Uncharacterized protein n=1 Tax=Mitosporidium daphniae TaxID=1485682 RepID=A0A098VQZ0_9MICR|nr:uncharacterized protein DI09_3p60 [Mitosporidium daphniae]KGG51244.1 hypothetical protein DI09_3p60 [Mitosporidium daphniae]|eukprot:XP_013237739.1 uncharacterized protein DI09_3p60 [Mitosporidium daphniae]
MHVRKRLLFLTALIAILVLPSLQFQDEVQIDHYQQDDSTGAQSRDTDSKGNEERVDSILKRVQSSFRRARKAFQVKKRASKKVSMEAAEPLDTPGSASQKLSDLKSRTGQEYPPLQPNLQKKEALQAQTRDEESKTIEEILVYQQNILVLEQLLLKQDKKKCSLD